jgi:hypothetical protein
VSAEVEEGGNMTRLQTGSGSEVASRAGSAGRLGLAGLAALFGVSCTAPTITPNGYSNRVGSEQMKADEKECFQYGMDEKRRLLNELVTGDPGVAKREGKESAAEGTASSLAKMEGSSSAGADAAGAVAGFLFSSWDPKTYDEDMLAKYLGIEGGLGDGFTATQRLQYICLRRKGYRVLKNEEDGSGIPHLEREPRARVMLREDDGTEVVFYEYVPSSER